MALVHKALELSKEHLSLFHHREGPSPTSNAWRAVDALDSLVQHLAGAEREVTSFACFNCICGSSMESFQ